MPWADAEVNRAVPAAETTGVVATAAERLAEVADLPEMVAAAVPAGAATQREVARAEAGEKAVDEAGKAAPGAPGESPVAAR